MKKIASETAARIIGSIANSLFWIAKKIMRIESPSDLFEHVTWNGFKIRDASLTNWPSTTTRKKEENDK